MAERAFRIHLGQPRSRQNGTCDAAALASSADRADLETLSLVVSRVSNAILITDASGTVQWVNEAFSRLSGYQEAEAVGHRIDQLVFGPSTAARSRQEFVEAIRTGRELTEDILQYRSDGTTFWAECKLIPVRDDKGHLSRWIVVQSDISRRRQAEEALRAAKQAAESSSRSKSEFLANMSHEIRTPLNAILGMTELALTTDLTREQRDYLRTVKSSADTLLELLNDVLDLSKIESGKMEIEEVDFNLADVVRETFKALSVRAHEKGLEMAVHMPMDIPQELRGDPTRIRQVLFNLIGNAIKFTESGKVALEVDQQWQTEDEIGLHMAVIDTGIGIPKEGLTRIFDAFAQADSSMARRFGGSGLGLTITAELLRLMDGRIWVQSSEGKGTTFHCSLTLKLAASGSRGAELRPPANLNGRRVLIVDDNATNRRILNNMASQWGMATTVCEGATAALERMASAASADHPFDLVLMDAAMPGIDGFQLARMIRQRTGSRPPVLVMLSSVDRPGSAARCKELGISAYLVRPISADALLDATLAALSTATDASCRTQPSLAPSPRPPAVGPARQLRVLLVDDHEPNRKLVESILRRRGHECRSEEDGDAAIRACRNEQFDVVLMDVQMPGRDGFSVTQTIREQERLLGTHVPIVALTAHALKGDRERCLAAGMDGYLAKPVHAAELVEVVEQYGSGHFSAARQLAVTKPEIHSSQVFNVSAALARMGGESDLLREHISYVLNDMPQLMRAMRRAVDDRDCKQLEIAAHRMRSLFSSYDHHDARDVTQQIEQHAKEGRLDDVAPMLDELEPMLQAFARAADDYLQST